MVRATHRRTLKYGTNSWARLSGGEDGSECEATNGYGDRQGSAICSDIIPDLFPLRAYKFFLHRFFIAVLSMHLDLDSETFMHI